MPPADWVPPARLLAVAATPRSGSNMFREVIATTGSLGDPHEWLHRGVQWPKDHPPVRTIEERCRVVVLKGMTPNRVAGVKLFAIQFDEIRANIDFDRWFPSVSWIWLRRRDFLRQAVSLALAAAGGRWTSQSVRRSSIPYSPNAVRRCLATLIRNERLWMDYFAAGVITPPVFWYEDIVGRLEDAVRSIAAYMQVDLSSPPDAGKLRMSRQSGEENEEWVARFRSERDADQVLSRLAELRLPS